MLTTSGCQVDFASWTLCSSLRKTSFHTRIYVLPINERKRSAKSFSFGYFSSETNRQNSSLSRFLFPRMKLPACTSHSSNGYDGDAPRASALWSHVWSTRDAARDARTTTVKTVPRCSSRSVVRLALFNARSVGEKSAALQQWITDMKLSLAALVETWHDDASSPQLIACAPPGFKYAESARLRKGSSTTTTTTI